MVDLCGYVGDCLLMDMYFLFVEGLIIENFVYCIKCCDFEVVGLVFFVYVFGYFSFVEDE